MPRTIPAERFHELVEAATQVFLEQGYRRSQMADVAARLGVAKGTLYLYVESKEALFDAVLRHADAGHPIGRPAALPVPTPPPGATLQLVEKRLAEESALPVLGAALAERRVGDVRGELEDVVRELFRVLARNRVGIKLVDRCSKDHPELAAVWFRAARGGALELLTRYLADRIGRGGLRPVPDVAVTARIVLETVAFWAVHRFWDPAPQAVEEAVAEQAVCSFVVRALCEE